MLSNFFAPLAMKISGGLIAVLLLAVAIQTVRANNAASEAKAANERATLAELSHRITAASLDTLQAELAAMVADGEIRAERRNAAMEAVAEETAELREQAEAFDIETVEGL